MFPRLGLRLRRGSRLQRKLFPRMLPLFSFGAVLSNDGVVGVGGVGANPLHAMKSGVRGPAHLVNLLYRPSRGAGCSCLG